MYRMIAAITAAVLVLSANPTSAAPPPSTSPSEVLPAAISFGTPERVVRAGHAGIDMAVDGDGHIHLVAADDAAVWYATDRTGAWTTRRAMGDIGGDGNVWFRPAIALDGQGRVHIVALRVLCIDCGPEGRWSYGIHYATDVGRERGTFPARPERLTWGGNAPSLAAHGSKLMVAYQPNRDGAEATMLYLLTKAGGAWTRSAIVRDGSSPSLQIGDDGKPRVAFATAHSLRFARARTTTGDWVIERIGSTGDLGFTPVLALDAQGGPHVATINWTGMRVRYVRRTATGWTQPVVVGRGRAFDLDVQQRATPWVLIGGDGGAQAFRPVGGDFSPVRVSWIGVPDGPVAAVAVLPSGSVIGAWYGGSDDAAGLWVSRS